MQAVYKFLETGVPLPEALALATRQAMPEASAACNFVCIGVSPSHQLTPTATPGEKGSAKQPVTSDTSSREAASRQPCEPPSSSPASAVNSSSSHPTVASGMHRPQATVPFEWGAPSGV